MSFNFNTELAFTPSYLELCIQQNGNCTIAQYISFKVQLFQWCAYKTMFFFLQIKKSSRKTFFVAVSSLYNRKKDFLIKCTLMGGNFVKTVLPSI